MEQQTPKPQIEWAYLAGYFDGEGCVSMNSKLQVYVSITSTDKIVLDYFAHVYGGRVREIYNKKSRRQLYQWMRTGTSAKEVLYTLLPWLKVKRFVAELGLKVIIQQHGKLNLEERAKRQGLRTALLAYNQRNELGRITEA